MPDLQLTPLRRPFQATISPPGSKSLTNRALVIASMARGTTTLSNVLLADDTRVMLDSLTRLGYHLDFDESRRTLTLEGGDVPNRSAELFCGNSGTTLRFLAASLARANGNYTLDGVERMRQRPVGQLGTLLKHLGVRVSYPLNEGYPPLVVHADGLPGGTVHFGSSASSQFLSAVLMAAPYARHEVRVELTGPQTSWPYVAMTMRLMDVFDALVELERDPETGDPKRIVVPRGTYKGTSYTVEPDASNASYFLAAAALHPGCEMTIEGLGRDSLQGDVAVAEMLARMGAVTRWGKNQVTVRGTDTLEGADLDLSGTPDVAQTLAVVAAFASSPTTLRGLHTLRVKETDRVAALEKELAKIGAHVEVHDAGPLDLSITVHPAERPRPAEIDTYDDHRMAMSFALAASKTPGITIRDAHCCSKTYPEFFDDFSRVLGLT